MMLEDQIADGLKRGDEGTKRQVTALHALANRGHAEAKHVLARVEAILTMHGRAGIGTGIHPHALARMHALAERAKRGIRAAVGAASPDVWAKRVPLHPQLVQEMHRRAQVAQPRVVHVPVPYPVHVPAPSMAAGGGMGGGGEGDVAQAFFGSEGSPTPGMPPVRQGRGGGPFSVGSQGSPMSGAMGSPTGTGATFKRASATREVVRTNEPKEES